MPTKGMPVLVAVDGETVPDKTVETGAELARGLDEELVILHVMPRELFDEHRDLLSERNTDLVQSFAPGVRYDAESNSNVSGSDSTYTIENGQRDAANVAQNVAEETLAEADNITYQGRVGEPVEEILAEATRRDAHYLIIGGRKRTPVGKAIFGSTTQAILLNADLPVVTVMQEE